MDTEYAKLLNSCPVIYFTFKDCKSQSLESLLFDLNNVVFYEYDKYYQIFKDKMNESESLYCRFFSIYDKLLHNAADIDELKISITLLERVLSCFYKTKPILLIDEYDTPIISSYEYGYHDALTTFFAGFYGQALKGSDFLQQAMLTGIQRVVKESIFSQLNNIEVYTVLDENYSGYFGFNEDETRELLEYYDLSLDERVKQKYNGYMFYKTEIYNPWSVLNYAKRKKLDNYWLNTSTNYLVRKSIAEAGDSFQKDFDKLIADGVAEVSADLSCSFTELKHPDTLWGLLVNAGYITALEQTDELFMMVRIPNGEVKSEFLRIIADMANLQSRDLAKMFNYLMQKDMDGFLNIYRELVINCTSFFRLA
jgi:hypothetical protein